MFAFKRVCVCVVEQERWMELIIHDAFGWAAKLASPDMTNNMFTTH